MFADLEYYNNTFKGTKITTADEYAYLANEASRYIKQYTDVIDEDSKSCECAIVEFLQQSKKQGNIASESIPNAYSVSYASNDKTAINTQINRLLALYLGDKYSAVGIVEIIG